AERAQMQERLQGAELTDGQTDRRHAGLEPRGHRLRRPHQLDVGVQGGHLGRRSAIVGRHSLNLNCFTTSLRRRCQAPLRLERSTLRPQEADSAMSSQTTATSARGEYISTLSKAGLDAPWMEPGPLIRPKASAMQAGGRGGGGEASLGG